ncbi:MAG TPA: DUF983 domain-containing protein [Gemmatimonadales bacterium]|nr:DUF983 domain-containing protein [Gemmatimonadales bacterium]
MRAVLRQRCPVCLDGPMFAGVFRMNPRCPRCGHEFEREPGFFQGAMYVSYGLGIVVFTVLALLGDATLTPRIGVVAAMVVAAVVYMPAVPVLFRYSRVIWAHVNVGTIPPGEA